MCCGVSSSFALLIQLSTDVSLEQSGLALDLSNLALYTVPSAAIEELPPLSTIDLANNFISCLAPCRRHLTDLQSLNLSHNMLASFAQNDARIDDTGHWVSPFVRLERLNLSNNRLWCMDQLPITLTELNVANNVIDKLPQDFSTLTNLRVLDLSRNRLLTEQGTCGVWRHMGS
jgi:Leucine-rich repeat (LRR) protein